MASQIGQLREAEKTLVCFIQGLEGQRCTIELRNDTAVTGVISDVDMLMNVFMETVELKLPSGIVEHRESMFIQGRQIRYVQIPDDVNVAATIQKRLALTDRFGKGDSKPRKKMKQSKDEKHEK